MTKSKAAITAVLVALLIALSSPPASAGSLDVVINGKSHHINSRYNWNESNVGLGLEYEFDDSSRWIKTMTASSFVDSMENMSYMAGVGLKRRLLVSDWFAGLYVDAGVVAFLMARKNINDYRPFPGALPALTIGNRYAGINLTYLPKKAVQEMDHARIVDPTISGVVFVQLKLTADAFRFR